MSHYLDLATLWFLTSVALVVSIIAISADLVQRKMPTHWPHWAKTMPLTALYGAASFFVYPGSHVLGCAMLIHAVADVVLFTYVTTGADRRVRKFLGILDPPEDP